MFQTGTPSTNAPNRWFGAEAERSRIRDRLYFVALVEQLGGYCDAIGGASQPGCGQPRDADDGDPGKCADGTKAHPNSSRIER
jgi:hypothetical protein